MIWPASSRPCNRRCPSCAKSWRSPTGPTSWPRARPTTARCHHLIRMTSRRSSSRRGRPVRRRARCSPTGRCATRPGSAASASGSARATSTSTRSRCTTSADKVSRFRSCRCSPRMCSSRSSTPACISNCSKPNAPPTPSACPRCCWRSSIIRTSNGATSPRCGRSARAAPWCPPRSFATSSARSRCGPPSCSVRRRRAGSSRRPSSTTPPKTRHRRSAGCCRSSRDGSSTPKAAPSLLSAQSASCRFVVSA